MKVKFTKRSKKDTTLVTVALSQFINSDEDVAVYFPNSHDLGEECILVIDGVPTVFTFARPDKDGVPTAITTRGFPRHLRLPNVGRPVFAEVTEIR